LNKKIIAGSRGSKLALVQTGSVIDQIRKTNPGIEVEIREITTTGDRDRQTHLDKIGVAAFVKELELALMDHSIDLAVHSLKDVPTEIPEGLCLIAVSERLDPRDVLVSSSKFDALAAGSRIGTGSLRRTVQINNLRPDIEVCSIRGNIDTRLRKVDSGEVDGTIVAAAALLRLGWGKRITEYLPLEHFLPAAGQGALVIETRIDDKDITDLISPLNHLPTWQSITAERAFLRTLDCGCRAPIAVLGTAEDSILKLKGMIADPDNDRILISSEEGNTMSPKNIGIRLAKKMLEMGACDFIGEVKDR